MNKIVASFGLVALGASGLQSVVAQELSSPDTSKPWSVSATLRGFYDDNPATVPNTFTLPPGVKRDTFGFEMSPSAALTWAVEQTTLNVAYLYSLKYYENTPYLSTSHDDQTHTFNASLSHAFSERFQGRVSDSFVIGQEPDMLRAGNAFSTFQRVSGSNIRNYGVLGLDAQLTPLFGVGVGYDNAYYSYADNTVGINPDLTVAPSLSGTLDRIENGFHIEGLYRILPETKGILGYRFRDVDFIGNQPIAGFFFAPIMSDYRNDREHVAYLGAEHNFRPDLTGSLRVGASYTDYYNDPTQSAAYTPYVNGSLRYTYAPESYAEVGFTYDRNPTDVVGLLGAGNVTVDSQSAVVYASLNHRITPKIFGSVIGTFQNSLYSGGTFNDLSEQYYLLGLNLEYRFTRNFSADIGYNYDNLQSEIGRTFDRNRVYIGVTASY